MKNKIKIVASFLLGAIIFGSVGVYAGFSINSKEITFIPNNNKWEVTNVDEALNNLYTLVLTENKNLSEPDYKYISHDGMIINDNYSLCIFGSSRGGTDNNLKLNNVEITPNLIYPYSGGNTILMMHIFKNLKNGDVISYTSSGGIMCWY